MKHYVCVDKHEYDIDPWHANFHEFHCDNRNLAKLSYANWYDCKYIDVKVVLYKNKHLLDLPAF